MLYLYNVKHIPTKILYLSFIIIITWKCLFFFYSTTRQQSNSISVRFTHVIYFYTILQVRAVHGKMAFRAIIVETALIYIANKYNRCRRSSNRVQYHVGRCYSSTIIFYHNTSHRSINVQKNGK